MTLASLSFLSAVAFLYDKGCVKKAHLLLTNRKVFHVAVVSIPHLVAHPREQKHCTRREADVSQLVARVEQREQHARDRAEQHGVQVGVPEAHGRLFLWRRRSPNEFLFLVVQTQF